MQPLVVLALIASLTSLAPLSAPRASLGRDGASCQTTPILDSLMLVRLRRIVTDTSAAGIQERAKWQLPSASPSEVMMVSDPATCAAAVAAYQRQFTSEVSFSSVRAYKVRTTYVIGPPEANSGEWSIFIVFNSTFTEALAKRRV